MRCVLAKGELVLTSAERAQLLDWSAADGSRLAVRARIVLACSEPGVVYARLAEELGVSVMTVHNVRRRFAEARLASLVDRPRSGRPKAGLSLTEEEREQLQQWGAAVEVDAGVAVQDRFGLCRRVVEYPGCDGTAGSGADGGEVAHPVRGAAAGGSGR
jgi:transposase-like protein